MAASRRRGTTGPSRGAQAHRMSAASHTRRATMVSGGSSLTATPTKKNEPPQKTESVSNIAHSRAVIVWFAPVILFHRVARRV